MNISHNINSMNNYATMMNTSASHVAKSSNKTSNIDLTKEITGQIEIERGFEAQIPAIQSADQMLGTLLDTKA